MVPTLFKRNKRKQQRIERFHIKFTQLVPLYLLALIVNATQQTQTHEKNPNTSANLHLSARICWVTVSLTNEAEVGEGKITIYIFKHTGFGLVLCVYLQSSGIQIIVWKEKIVVEHLYYLTSFVWIFQSLLTVFIPLKPPEKAS